MRFFIAIDLPLELKQFLIEINSELKRFNGVKTVERENTHLTLLFLGEKPDFKEIVSNLKIIQYMKFRVEVSNIGFFPDSHHIKVVWLGVKKSKDLTSLQKQIAILFDDYKDYVPHLTFARVKSINRREKEELLEIISKFNKSEFSFEVDKFKLYSSELTSFGPIHRVVDTFSSID